MATRYLSKEEQEIAIAAAVMRRVIHGWELNAACEDVAYIYGETLSTVKWLYIEHEQSAALILNQEI